MFESDWSRYIKDFFFPQCKTFLSLYFAATGINKNLEWNQSKSEICAKDLLYVFAALSRTGETAPAFPSYIITRYKGGSAMNAAGLFPPGVPSGRVCQNTPSRQPVRSARMFWKTACSEWECNNSRLIFQQPALIALINSLVEVRRDAYQRFLP